MRRICIQDMNDGQPDQEREKNFERGTKQLLLPSANVDGNGNGGEIGDDVLAETQAHDVAPESSETEIKQEPN